MRSDKELLDGLQRLLGRYTGKVICRWSTTGRGWRLHETNSDDASLNVRFEINNFLDEEERRKK